MTDTTTQPVVTEGAQAPLDPVIMEMLDHQVNCTVWPFVDNAATNLELEEKKKAEPHFAWEWKHCRVYKYNLTEIAAAKAFLKNLNPQDTIECMLASQLTGVYFASMECLNLASWAVDDIETRIYYLNAASKLGRTLAELVKALDNHRGKGTSKQEITVQHVYINEGGQAIVGNVASQGGRTEKSAK